MNFFLSVNAVTKKFRPPAAPVDGHYIDVERVPGEEVVFDCDFRSYAMWDKPRFRARFRPVGKE